MPVSASFNKVDYDPSGDSFVSSSKFISSQISTNLIAVPTPQSSSGPAAMMSMYGLKIWSSGSSTEIDRGIFKYLFKGLGWKVSGNTLYSFDFSGTQKSVGAIPGSGLVKMSSNSTVLLIVAPGVGAYSCDGSNVTAVSLTFTPVDLTFLNNQFILLDSDGVVWVGDPGTTDFRSSNTFLAESQTDRTIAVEAFNQFLLVFGEKTIEPTDNTGIGSPPFERMNGAIIEEVGLSNGDCIAITKSALYMLGNDNLPYQLINFQTQEITQNNPGIAELFISYNKTGAFISQFQCYGQNIIAYHFPKEGKVWCFSELTRLWFAVDHGVNGQIWTGQTSQNLFKKWLVGDKRSGNIYELDQNTYQNNGVAMVRERVFRPLSGETLSSPRDYFQMRSGEFNCLTGVGVNDDNPQMMISYSIDGGNTFSNERWLSLGEAGDYQEFIEDYQNKKFKDLAVKVRYMQNTDFTLGSAGFYVRRGGR